MLRRFVASSRIIAPDQTVGGAFLAPREAARRALAPLAAAAPGGLAKIGLSCVALLCNTKPAKRRADVAKSADAADFYWSARGETRGAEPLKLGESTRATPPPIPSQALAGEGVETRRAAPKSGGYGEGIVQTTNAIGRRRKPKWYENLLLARECGFEPRRPHHPGSTFANR